MLIPKNQISSCLELVKEVNYSFSLNLKYPRENVESIDDFLSYCREEYGVINVHVHTMDFNGQAIFGMMFSISNPLSGDMPEYTIMILDGLRTCWKRFVICKELFHVILDTRDKQRICRNPDISLQVEQTILSIHDMENITPPAAAVESIAEICAMEFLLPYSYRKELKATRSESVAELFKVPNFMVEKYLSDSMMDKLNPDNFK